MRSRSLSLHLACVASLLLASQGHATADDPGWKHSGSMYLLTTPEGADIPAPARVEGYPALVRLHRDFFDFDQAGPHGEDIRFTSAGGEPLSYQIEEWDAARGQASVWVRLPSIEGNERREIRLRWGNPAARSESDGRAVFNASNGYLSVWHMDDPARDEVGTLSTRDTGTSASAGVIGRARHFPGGKGVFGGDKIPDYPSGAASHSTEAWFRAEVPNTTIVGWGNEAGGRGSKIRMQLRSPPHVHIDSNFSDVDAPATLPLGEWVHVVHTYDRRDGRVYLNGKLEGSARPELNIKSPARLWIGGWYHDYDFVGDIDEVRISSVARPAAWVRLQYENLRPMQTLVGPLVRPGDRFSASPESIDIKEGRVATVSAEAGGAQKVYWLVIQDGRETVTATDRFSYRFEAGRVLGDRSATLRFKAIYPDSEKTRDIPIRIEEAIPDPAFTLRAPATWDGRGTIEVVPEVENLEAMRAAGAGDLSYAWTLDGLAATRQVAPGRLVLKRAHNSGELTVKLALSNGGRATERSTTIRVAEPSRDAWARRVPGKDEKPVDGQFFARDDEGEGTLHYNGSLAGAAEAVYLKLYADGKPVGRSTQKPRPDGTYAFSVGLKPGLIRYKVEFGSIAGDGETLIDTVSDLVCGDAYLIDGQSNAVATDFGKDDPTGSSEWIRSFGSMAGDPQGARLDRWAHAVVRDRQGGKAQVGYWGMELARRLVEARKIPICIINGAVGGTRIDLHQRNDEDPTDVDTIYGRLLWRVRRAGLTHGIRGVFWHQGENDQGADGPTGGYGWETYRQYFIDMASAWKEDYPNIRHYYAFQIWPRACSMGIDGSDNRLREVQRRLPSQFSNLSVMSTLGIKPPGGCHFPAAGYSEFARLIGPLVERDNYGKDFDGPITPPDLVRAGFSNDARDEVILEFDQPVACDDSLAGEFTLDGRRGLVASCSAVGHRVSLKLVAPTDVKRVTYLDGASWSQDRLLWGKNGIAALTFCEVPILPARR